MVRSANKAFLSVAGYNATIGTASVVSTTTPTNKRTLASLSQNGTITTSAYDIFSGNNFRSIASNGYSFWSAGAPTAGVGLYYHFNRAASPVSLGSINTRVVQIFNNNLYFSSAASGNIGVFQTGADGLPIEASAAAVTRLTDATYASSGSPYAFSINPAGNVLYVSDDGAFSSSSTQAGGVIKYTKSGSVWSYQYTHRVTTNNTSGCRGLEVDWSGPNPVLYMTSSLGTEIYKLTDAGSATNGGATALAAAGTNYVFRGLQFAPETLTSELTSTASLLAFGTQPQNGVSPEKSFNVAGTGFTGNITVTAPGTSPSGQYGVSLTPGGPYASSVIVTGSGSPRTGNATVYMVLQPTAVGVYNGNLSISATGATTVLVPVTGSCINPVNYYNVASSDLTNPNNWGTNTDGGGTKPTNFTDNGQYFNIVNTPGNLASAQTTAALSPQGTTASGTNVITFASIVSCPTSPASFYVGAPITGAGIPGGTTISTIVGNTITLSANATASATVTLSVPVSSPWTISGTLSKLIVGDGVVARTFTIPATYAYSGTVDVNDNGTLTLQNSSIPTLGVLTTNSTVVYNQTGSATVVLPLLNGPYGNLTLLGNTLATDLRTLPASGSIAVPFQVDGNFLVDKCTVLGQASSPFTYMGLGGNLTGANGAVFCGAPALSTAPIFSVITTGNGNQTISYPAGTVNLFTFTSTKSAGTLTLGNGTTLLTYGQSGAFEGTMLTYSGTAAFVSNAGSSLDNTGSANTELTFTGSSSFTLGGNLDAANLASTSFTVPESPNCSVYFNFAAGTSFADGGHTISVSNNFGTKGSKAAYNLTGSVVMTPSDGSARIQNDNSLQGLCVADLNNLTITPVGSAGNISIQPTTGNNTLTIKGGLLIGGSATASKLQPNGNTIEIGGDFTDVRTIDMIAGGTCTFEFNGTGPQTFSTNYASGESFYNVVINNTAGVTQTTGNMRISNNLACQNGILTAGVGNKVILNTAATITETTTSNVIGFVESQRTLTNALETFGGMGMEITALGTAPGVTTLSRETGTSVAIGCPSASNKRIFTVTPAANTGLNATVTYRYLGSVAELNGLDENDFSLFTGGGPWALTSPQASLNTATNRLTITGQNALGSYVASIPSPTLGTIAQTAVCANNTATVDMTGLLPNATFTVSYSINAVAQTPVSGVNSNALGEASFITGTLTSANNGQTLAITALNRTDISPNCNQAFSSGNTVVLSVHPNPTLITTTQSGGACDGSNATINLTGLANNSTFNVQYNINGGATQTINGVVATGTTATLAVPVVLANNGHTFTISSLTITSATPNCSFTPSSGNTTTLGVHPRPTVTISANDFVCEGQTAPIGFYLTGTGPWNMQYTINGGAPVTANGIATSPLSAPYVNATIDQTYVVTTLSDANCTAQAADLDGRTIVVPNPCSITWNGSQNDGDWTNANNWTPNNSAPSQFTSVVIPGGVFPPNVAGSQTCATVRLKNQPNMAIAFGGQLNVKGDLIGAPGGRVSGVGKLVMSGTGLQTVSGSVWLSNIDFANTSAQGVEISPTGLLSIDPSATTGSGVVTFLANSRLNTNGKLTLASNSMATGKIGPIPTSAIITGEITQERYLPWSSGSGHWYFLGSPFGGKNFTDYADDFKVVGLTSGFGSQGGSVLPSNEPERSTIFGYNESLHNLHTDTVQKQGWRIPGNISLDPGTGYRVYVNHFSNTNHKVDNKGTLTRNDFSFPVLTHTTLSGCIPASFPCDEVNLRGWNLLANPYPCDVDWDATGGAWTKPGQMNNAFYTWNANAGGYRVYLGTTGTPGVSLGSTTASTNTNPSLIASGQAFFVNVTSPGSFTLTVKEAAKSVSSNASFTRSALANNQLRIRLTKANSENRFEAMVRFDEGATDGFDQHMDVASLAGNSFAFSLYNNLLLTAIAPVVGTRIIPMHMSYAGDFGEYTFTFTEFETMLTTHSIYLKDNLLGTLEQISAGFAYHFSVVATNDLIGDRFELVFNANAVTATHSLQDGPAVVMYPNPSALGKSTTLAISGFGSTKASIRLTNALGQAILQKSIELNSGTTEYTLSEYLPAGVYTLITTGAQKEITQKLIVQ